MTEILRTLVVCLLLTIVFEEGTALLFHIRRKNDLFLVLIVNILTNPPAVLLLLMLNPTGIFRFFYIVVAETSVILLEGAIYRAGSEEIPHPRLFSLTANAVSFSAGILLSNLHII